MVKTRKIPLRKSVVSNEIIDKARFAPRVKKIKEGQKVFIDQLAKPMVEQHIKKARQ